MIHPHRLDGCLPLACDLYTKYQMKLSSYLNYINDSFSEHRAISFHQILLSGSPSVAENQPPGTKIGSFTSVDSNSNDRHTYSIVRGGAGKFELQGANLITLITFNYETSPNT